MRKNTLGILLGLVAVGGTACDVGNGGTGNGKPSTVEACQDCQFLGQDAVCLPDSIPQIQAALADPVQGPALRSGAAACKKTGMVCVPCMDPTTGKSTGACDIGAAACSGVAGTCDNPAQVLDPASFPPCASDAHCLPNNLVATAGADFQSRLAACPNDSTSSCVPDAFIRTGGNYKPPTCSSVAGAEGRCLSTALPEISKQGALLPQSTCAASERCAPCFDPLTGAATGACSLTCDTGPTTAAVVLASCVNNGGRCIPATSIPAAQQESLDPRDCDNVAGPGYLCVPNIILQNGPYTVCSGRSLFVTVDRGVCLPTNILKISGSGALPTGNCDNVGNGFKCVPCERDGQPTGAPGCTP